MPVSPLSSGNAAVGSERSSEQIARWNSTRDQQSEDEGRISEDEVDETNGHGLHDRTDWPLPERRPSPVTEHVSQQPQQQPEWKKGGHHVSKVERDTSWLHEPDVSDIEEDSDEEANHLVAAELRQKPGNNGTASNRESVHITERVMLDNEARHRTSLHSDPPSPRSSAVQSRLPSDHARVSPVRYTSQDSSDSDVKSTNSAVSLLEQQPGDTLLEETTDGSPAAQTYVTPAAEGAPFFDDALMNEQLDSTPPLPSEAFRHTPDIPRSSTQSPTQSPPGARRPSDGTTYVRHARHSSAAKPGFQGYHSRQSSYNTTQIPSNRDRVRYSWQSVHEDESNKPRIHVIKLVSNTASASSAFPQGEAFGFSISPSGRRIAVYNSARLYILQTAALPVGISQDFSIKRRPLAVELNDSGSLVAILADEHTVNVYDLSHSKLKRIKTVKLDFPTNCIAIASCGGLLAAAYEGGIEVFSLASTALPTDRRAVRAPKMDRLTFSEDGSTLLGTTTRIHASSTVIVNVPVFPSAPNGIPTFEELKLAWCSELLHPENIRNSSHATFMREDRSVCNEHVFAWNGLADTFGILNTGDMEYGPVDFPLEVSPPLSTCGGLGAAIHSCPAVDEFGDTVAMIVNDRTIRLYMVPHNVDESVEAHSIDHELDDGYGCPFLEVRWVHSPAALPTPMRSSSQPRGRLLVTSPGGVFGPEQIEDSFEEIEGGRIILFDFDPQFAGQPGQTFILNLGKSPPQPLEEEEYDVADAVALVRRRTVKQNNAGDMRPISLGKAATTLNSTTRNHSRPTSAAMYSRRTASILSVGSTQTESSRSLPDLMEGVENSEVLEEPFSNQAPRSQASLQRAASNAQRHRYQSIEERNQENVGIDSTGNFLPLPEYTEEPNAPLPSRFRAMAGLDTPASPMSLANGQHSAPPTSHSVPMSAPPATAQNFSADRAFAAANASLTTAHSQNGTSMPRGLLRAYSNAASGLRGHHQSRTRPRDGTGESLSSHPRDTPFHNSFAPSSNGGRSAANEDMTSPMNTSSNSMIARAYDNRFSTPLSAITDYQNSIPRRSSSTRRPGEHIYGSPRNYNMQAFRQATATASLFPPAQSSDHLPLPSNHQVHSTGAVAHPITGWRPPAPSAAVPPQSPGQHSRGHSRKSSIASKGAFPSTAKAKKLGFFKKKSAGGRSSAMDGPGDDGTVDDSKSMMTWMTTPEKKCAVM